MREPSCPSLPQVTPTPLPGGSLWVPRTRRCWKGAFNIVPENRHPATTRDQVTPPGRRLENCPFDAEPKGENRAGDVCRAGDRDGRREPKGPAWFVSISVEPTHYGEHSTGEMGAKGQAGAFTPAPKTLDVRVGGG